MGRTRPGAGSRPRRGRFRPSSARLCPACRAEQGNLARRTRHHGRVPEIDDDQLAALRRLRAAFGPIEVVEAVSHDRSVGPDASMQAYALLMRALTDPNWRTAGQALDDLMRKLVVHRQLEVE